jgi:peptide/nickel transport system permease protein
MLSVVPKLNVKSKPVVSGLSKEKRILRSLILWIPLAIMVLTILVAIFAPFLTSYEPTQGNMQERFLPPGSHGHLLGTDKLGRDVWARLLFGTRVSLSVSFLAIAITSVVGTVLGILAGFMGGKVDAFIMRVTDIAIAFPGMVIALLLATGLGPGFFTVVFALSILGWAGYSRLIRGEALRVRESDYVAQARINGASSWRIMYKHVFPNIANILIIGVTLSIGGMILAESGLSFIGIGIPAPAPSWGAMVSDGRSDIDRAWWVSMFPGIAIGLVVLAGNFLGDWIRDKMDPRLRQL